MGSGGLVLRHTRAGIPTYLICATYGEAGWTGKPAGAKKEDLPEIRAKELEEAAAALALNGVELWDYPDGGVSAADHPQISQRITEQIVKLRPRAVVGWGPDGGYGHLDHIWIGACTDAAIVALDEAERPALYHLAIDQPLAEFYREAMRLGAKDGGMALQTQDSVDIVIELNADEVMMKLRALDCPQSQLEDRRVAVRSPPQLVEPGYGREPSLTPPAHGAGLTASALPGEFG